MSDLPPILDGDPPTPEQLRLAAFFDDLEKNQIDYLDQANKRIIELATALLGSLFAVFALGKDFPPPYLTTLAPKLVAILALGGYVGALLCAFLGIQPKRYFRFNYNLTGMREELEKMFVYKSRWFRLASAAFSLATVFLSILLVLIIV